MQEWSVWMSFWAEALGNRDFAAENGRHYAEWREALEVALLPLMPSKVKRERETLTLMALIDGLSVQLVLLGASGARLSTHQQAARDLLGLHLESLRPPRSKVLRPVRQRNHDAPRPRR